MKRIGGWILVLSLLVGGCSFESAPENGGTTTDGGTTGSSGSGESFPQIRIDGSSTVEPLSAAMAQVWAEKTGHETPVVRASGTGGGFEKFARKESDISDASRPIKEKEEQACRDAGLEPVGLMVAIDGLSILVHKDNDWCKALTVAQLKQIWAHGSTITKWNQLDPAWPDAEISLFGADTKSGTFDYFKEAIVGSKPEDLLREDYQPSADDNQLVEGVSGQKYALGFIPFSYYLANQDKLQAIAVSPTDNIADAVAPTRETIEGGTYKPLSRPLFIYATKEGLKRADIADFCTFYLSDAAQEYVKLKDFNPLPKEKLEASRAALQQALAGE